MINLPGLLGAEIDQRNMEYLHVLHKTKNVFFGKHVISKKPYIKCSRNLYFLLHSVKVNT